MGAGGATPRGVFPPVPTRAEPSRGVGPLLPGDPHSQRVPLTCRGSPPPLSHKQGGDKWQQRGCVPSEAPRGAQQWLGAFGEQRPPPKQPPRVTSCHGCAGSEWEEDVTGAQTNLEVSQSDTLGLAPTCPYRDRCRGTPSPSPRPRWPFQEQPPAVPRGLGGFWGSPAASNLQEKQPPILGLACPALSRLPNPSHMVSISLGSAGACSAVSELTFPCLSMRLLARDARPSPRPWSSPALPVRTRLSRPRGGCGEAGAGSCLCSALKLQPGRASRRSLPGEVPAPACLLFPRRCSPPRSFPRWDSPTGQCWGRPQNAALSPQSAPRRRWSEVWARCHGKGWDPGCSSDPMAVPLTPCRLSGPLRVILIVPPCLRN